MIWQRITRALFAPSYLIIQGDDSSTREHQVKQSEQPPGRPIFGLRQHGIAVSTVDMQIPALHKNIRDQGGIP